MTTAGLMCDFCGRTENLLGVPFTELSLRVHKARMHSKHKRKKTKKRITKCFTINEPSSGIEFKVDSFKQPLRVAKAESTISYCPCCGQNLAAFNAALNL